MRRASRTASSKMRNAAQGRAARLGGIHRDGPAPGARRSAQAVRRRGSDIGERPRRGRGADRALPQAEGAGPAADPRRADMAAGCVAAHRGTDRRDPGRALHHQHRRRLAEVRRVQADARWRHDHRHRVSAISVRRRSESSFTARPIRTIAASFSLRPKS